MCARKWCEEAHFIIYTPKEENLMMKNFHFTCTSGKNWRTNKALFYLLWRSISGWKFIQVSRKPMKRYEGKRAE
jgi:hypothetical protein